jgi:hypothetical protein
VLNDWLLNCCWLQPTQWFLFQVPCNSQYFTVWQLQEPSVSGKLLLAPTSTVILLFLMTKTRIENMPILFSLCYNGILVTWMVVSLLPSSLSSLYFLCLASSCPMLRTYSFSGFCVISHCCLHSFVI